MWGTSDGLEMKILAFNVTDFRAGVREFRHQNNEPW